MNRKVLGRLTAVATAGSLVVLATVAGTAPANAVPVSSYGIALRVALNAQAGDPLALVADANVTVAAAYAPPDSSVAAVDVAAALAGLTGVAATSGTATADATSSATQNFGASRVEGLAAAVLGRPTSATALAGTATCPVFGTPTAATTVTGLNVFGQAITATVNGPTVTVNSATTVAGVTNAVISAAVRTRIQNVTATTATATALQLTLTLTGTVNGAPISVPLGTIAAGTASCVRPALPAPTETGLTPKSGPTAGGTRVTVTGSGFDQGATTVTIGGITIPAADVTVTSPTTLSFVTPPHAAGPVQVTTTTGGGTSAGQTYTYVPPPTETGLNPKSGPTTGGTTVTVTGTGFVPGATTVSIGSTTVPATGVTVTSPTTLTFVTPPHAAGPVQVITRTAGAASAGQTYTYVPPPAPTGSGLDPTSGPTAGGTTVTVTGTGFIPGGTTVTIGGITIPAGSVTVTSPTSLTFSTPAHDAGPVDLTVTTAGGISGPLTYTYLDAAAIAAANGSNLANTGSATRTPLVLGLLALLSGAALLLAGRRRKLAQPS